jgi:hypothetical protein
MGFVSLRPRRTTCVEPISSRYLLFSPLIYLLTPSNNSALQSILYALSAPVLYDDDAEDVPVAKDKAGEDKKTDEKETGDKPRSATKVRRDGVKGGGIIRDSSWIP